MQITILNCIVLLTVLSSLICGTSCGPSASVSEGQSPVSVSTTEPREAANVVESYLLAVRENRRSDAEANIVKPIDRYRRIDLTNSDSNSLQFEMVPNNPDWFAYLRAEEFSLERIEPIDADATKSTIRAVFTIPKSGTREFNVSLIFNVEKRENRWMIKNIDFDSIGLKASRAL